MVQWMFSTCIKYQWKSIVDLFKWKFVLKLQYHTHYSFLEEIKLCALLRSERDVLEKNFFEKLCKSYMKTFFTKILAKVFIKKILIKKGLYDRCFLVLL